jgi:transcriptional regulator with XRE-family HTH domain
MKTKLPPPFAARLTALREGKEFSQRGLAKAAGLSQQTVNNLEHGVSEPTLETAKKLAGALGVTLEQLAG